MTQQSVASVAVLAGNTIWKSPAEALLPLPVQRQQLANQFGWVYFEFCPYMDLSLAQTVFLVK